MGTLHFLYAIFLKETKKHPQGVAFELNTDAKLQGFAFWSADVGFQTKMTTR